MSKNIVLLTAKFPDHKYQGQIKSRLGKTLHGKEIFLYEAFLRDTIHLATNPTQWDVAILGYPSNQRHDFEKRYHLPIIPSSSWNILTALKEGFEHVFRHGYTKAIALNTDSPDLPQTLTSQAFSCLTNNDVVIGPTYDGGYYCIGMKQVHPQLFTMNPSTKSVTAQTIALSKRLHLAYTLLSPWWDIDTYEELIALKSRLQSNRTKNCIYTREILFHEKT